MLLNLIFVNFKHFLKMKTYKVIFAAFVAMVLGAFVITGCSNEEIPESQTKNNFLKREGGVFIETPPIGIEQIKHISSQLVELYGEENISLELIDPSDENLKIILQPLLNNGKSLYNELITFVGNTNEWNNLSAVERNAILSFDDSQFIELSLYTSIAAYGTSSIDWDRVASCAALAFGIRGIQESISAFALQGATIDTVVGALRVIGRRYLGYIGVALIIYDFVSCFFGNDD